MNALLPILLVGGVVGLALNHQPETPRQKAATAGVGLGGYLQGTWADFSDDMPMAREGYLAALTDDPDNPRLRALALESALAVGDVATAERLAKAKGEQLSPGMPALLQLVAAVRSNDVMSAKQALHKLQKEDSRLQLLTVLDAYLATRSGTKVQKVMPVLKLEQGWGSRWHRTRLLVNAGQTAEALAQLRAADRDDDGVLMLALQHLHLETDAAKRAEIRQRFRAANPTLAPLVGAVEREGWLTGGAKPTTLADDTAAALLDFTMQLMAQQQPKMALQVLQLAMSLNPTEPTLAKLLPYYAALLHQLNGDIPAAQTQLQALVKTGGMLGQLAGLQLAELDFSLAKTPRTQRRAAERAWALAQANPQEVVFWNSAGQLALAAKQFDRAAEISTRLLAVLPASPAATLAERQAQLYFARGAAYVQAGKSAKAEADLQQAIQLNPAHADALNYLGYLWVDENRNLDQAYAMLKRAHLLAPGNGAITDSVGWAYFRKGDYETARQYLELAAKQEPGMPEILSHLADTYAKLGNQAEAEKLWKRAYDLVLQGAEVPSDAFVRELKDKAR